MLKDPAGTDYKAKVQPPLNLNTTLVNMVGGLALSSRNANGADLVNGKGLEHGTYYPSLLTYRGKG